MSDHILDQFKELELENKALRECLARIAEKLNIELPNEAPKGVTTLYEHLMLELDKWECIWKQEKGEDMEGTYRTGCNNLFGFVDGTTKDNHFKYCPYCGGKLKEKETR